MTAECEYAYSVVLQLSANCVQNEAGSGKKPDRLLALVHLKEEFLDAAVELLGQAQSLCKFCLLDKKTRQIESCTKLRN